MKKIEEIFDFLIKDYNLLYKSQIFYNCYGSWTVVTHSFYNDSGCFTIYDEVQRGIGYYCSSQFSTEWEKLSERPIDVCTIEPDIWEKERKIWIFERPFFLWSQKRELNVLSKVLKIHLSKNNNFFGIQV